ncbi:hypothetical protein AB833_15855 [Chromatiales bacterium (ex Bugula neritina AB1)]|nr:hypothetical protein AB833_15855 [Chromatiales bacterium (ex Bugula neritina AB1)]
MTELTLTVERIIDAPAETLYNAWLDPQMLKQFMTPDDGVVVSKAEVDAVEGGRYLILMESSERQMPHTGTYLTLNPFSQIAFTWESPFSTDDSTVTIDFKPADNGVRVIINHIKFISEEMRNNHEKGWTQILEVIDTLLHTQTSSA